MKGDKELWDIFRQKFDDAPEASAPLEAWQDMSNRLAADANQPKGGGGLSTTLWIAIPIVFLLGFLASSQYDAAPELTAQSFPLATSGDSPTISLSLDNTISSVTSTNIKINGFTPHATSSIVVNFPNRETVAKQQNLDSPINNAPPKTNQVSAQNPLGHSIAATSEGGSTNVSTVSKIAKDEQETSQEGNSVESLPITPEDVQVPMESEEFTAETMETARIAQHEFWAERNETIAGEADELAPRKIFEADPRVSRFTLGIESEGVDKGTRFPSVEITYRGKLGFGLFNWIGVLSSYRNGWSESINPYATEPPQIDLGAYEQSGAQIAGYSITQSRLYAGLGLGFQNPILSSSRWSVFPYVTILYQFEREGMITIDYTNSSNPEAETLRFDYFPTQVKGERYLMKAGLDLQYQLSRNWAAAVSVQQSRHLGAEAKGILQLKLAGHYTF